MILQIMIKVNNYIKRFIKILSTFISLLTLIKINCKSTFFLITQEAPMGVIVFL